MFPNLRFHHIGVITGDIEASIELYKELGYSISVIHDDPVQKAKIVLLHSEQGPPLELIEPKCSDSPAMGWIKRIKAGPYHTCYEVDNLEQAVDELRTKKIVPVSDIAPAVAFDTHRIVFLWGTACGLIELVEIEKNK